MWVVDPATGASYDDGTPDPNDQPFTQNGVTFPSYQAYLDFVNSTYGDPAFAAQQNQAYNTSGLAGVISQDEIQRRIANGTWNQQNREDLSGVTQSQADMQTRGLGIGRTVDPTAGAASFLVQQAMRADMAASAGAPGQPAPPSYDAALGDALGDAAKAVVESLIKK